MNENLSAFILNELYGYKLINANSEITNACAVDLIDRENKVAIQVTSRIDGKKRFIKAIEGTIEALNTGVYRLRDGSVIKNISPRSNLKDRGIREVLSSIIDDLIDLRYLYEELIRKSEIKLCGYNDENCGVHFISPFAIEEMVKARKSISFARGRFSHSKSCRCDAICLFKNTIEIAYTVKTNRGRYV